MLNYKAIFIVISAFAVRISALFLLGRHVKPELWEYDKIALNLIQNREYSIEHLNTIYRSYIYPVYPFISAVFNSLTKYNYFILEMFQVALSAMTCYFIYLIAKKIYNEQIGLFSSLLVALHPGLIIYSTKIHELTLVIFLIVTIFWFILSLGRAKIYNNILIGALIGIGTLTRPTIIFLFPVYFVYLWQSNVRGKSILKTLLTVSLCTILVMLPWTIRNYKIHKRWIFITTSSAQQLWMGNNPGASGSGLAQDGLSVLNHSPKDFQEELFKLNEIQQHDFFYSEAVKFIKSNFYLFTKMVSIKFFYFWWFSPQVGKLYPATWTIIYKAYYSIFFIFFISGCFFSVKSSSNINTAAVLSLFILFFLVSFLHSIYYIEIRHRWSIEPLMCIFSAVGFRELLKKAQQIVT